MPALIVLLSILLWSPITQAGELRVATVGDYPPFNFVSDAGELEGFDVDVARALCARMDVTCELLRHPWAELIPGLRAGRFDAVAASMSITAERRRLVSFTNRYYRNTSRFVSHKAARFDPEKPAGRAVGAMRGTIASDWLRKNMPEALLLFYRSPDDLLRDLGANKLDAAFGDELGAYAWLNARPGFTFVGSKYRLDEGIGIAVRKEDKALLRRLNEALEGILADGTYRKINAKYFPFSIY